ncbi:SphA family protein [Celeribacter sp. SCSIO 80788]|uniref:SphA family protein n=1 Tax=Celeribacter sp. SCSIO 80788 TaxID=3117013 RepID=UPI003DA4F96F
MKRLTQLAAGLAATLTVTLTLSTAAQAREPGVLPAMAPGATMGVPIAAPLPEGFLFSSRTGYSQLTYKDADGNETDTKIDILDTALVLNYVPGTMLFGGQYRASLALPIIDARLSGDVSAHSTGIGSLDIRPVDISWEIAPGIFASAGVSILAPGDWDADNLINPGQNFWSLAPSVGFSYLRDGWNASAHVIYTTNQRNDANGYKSGDDLNIHLTAMKDVGNGLSLGPVAYLRKQMTADSNRGTSYGGGTAAKTEAAGIGLSATKQFGNVIVNAMYTHDVSAEESGSGDRLWLNFALPLPR